MLRDFIIKDGVEVVVHQVECIHRGAKLFRGDGPVLAKERGCGNCPSPVIFTPIYECALFGRCAPFTSRIYDEQDRTHTCMACPKKQKPNQ